MKIRFLLVACFVSALVGCVTTAPTPTGSTLSSQDTCERPFVFFDLGNTILDTRTHNFEKIFYIPGALEYLMSLRQEGYRIGLLVNVPDSWGKDDAEKMRTLREFTAKSWSDPRPMDWDLFDAGIFFPNSAKERKPHPALFQRAARLARAQGCSIVYQGEVQEELTVAATFGIRTYQVGKSDLPFFMPLESIAQSRLPSQ